ncbi:antA/AntB antirepressor family protein [Escherichia coli]|nr:antA/AntB antirepressor family protein [Escherichia coli]
MTSQLIPVFNGTIANEITLLVNARDLHTFLGVGKRFASWITERIAEYGFVENQDYILVSPNREIKGRGGDRRSKDYHLTLDTAKELAMVERTEQGRAVRQYFIKCEEELHKVAPVRSAALRRELKARITVASYFKPMCAALEAYRAELGKNTLQHHYTTEANMLARIVLGGMTAKQWAQANGITGEPRDHMSVLQLEHLSYLEQSNITLIELGLDYHQRKAELIRLSQRWLARRMEVSSHA